MHDLRLLVEDLYQPVPLIDVQLPPLPSLSPAVWHAAFVHESKTRVDEVRSKFNYPTEALAKGSNERLEWVGDALL